jgi:hypothetical protein
MTPAQLDVLQIIRANPYFCKNEYVLRQRTRTIKESIDRMRPKLEQRLQALGVINDENERKAINIIREEMNKLLQHNYNAIIVKANLADQNLSYIDQDHQAYLVYYFLTDSIYPYMATLTVDPEGIIHFYNPPAALLSEETTYEDRPLNKNISKQLCDILKLPLSLLDHGPQTDSYKQAS